MSISAGSFPPQAFQRAMVFIDGTNLFHRLEAEKLKITVSLEHWWVNILNARQLIRTCLYTSQPHFEKAKQIHAENAFDGVRVIFGDAIPNKDGGVKEKGVDALLVADLIYHAATKNFSYAALVSVDTDFTYAIKRVEDFGCQTSVVGVCALLPERLKASADKSFEITRRFILERRWAIELNK